MKIDRITLHNFKSFEGTCHINGLSEHLTSERKILLFGGMNGAGKTTIFEALLLCLYGRLNKTLWPSKGAKREDYQHYIVSVTNNNAKSDAIRTEMFIELYLKEVDLAGIPRSLTVRRTWMVDNHTNSLSNDGQLTILEENDQELDFVSVEDWEQFILELIPYEVSQFFFFDGEKIQEFVRDEDKEFAESLERVLGISLYDRLKNDLEEVRRRILRDYNKDEDAKLELTKIDAELAELEKHIRKHDESIERVEDTISNLEERISDIDQETRRITRVQTELLSEYRTEKESLLAEKVILEEKVLTAIQDDLPFVITGALCSQLLAQLNEESRLEEFKVTKRGFQPKIEQISNALFSGEEPIPSLQEGQKIFYQAKLIKVLENMLAQKPKDLDGIKEIHNLSRTDSEQIRFRIEGTVASVRKISAHLRCLQEIEPKLKKIRQAESKSDDPEANRLYEERGSLAQEKSTKEKIQEGLLVEKQKLKDEISSKQSQRTILEKKLERTLSRHEQIDYTKRLKSVLDSFSHRLRTRKVAQLQEYTLDMWGKLSHKKDHVKSIIINPDRQFSIELYDARDRKLDKTKLSAGEKELLAISLIWALSKLANRSLPVVIDTPLGRLDSVHRENIARNYFSNASHQVILLSTNTEIIGKEYEAVKPFLCKQFLITKDSALKTSKVNEGYFN